MKRPWFKFYPGDWLNGTRGLSLEERGAYMTLIALMYDEQGAIPDDERWVCGALDCDVRVWRRLKDKLCRCGKLVPNGDGFLSNRRVLEELTYAELVADVRRKSGRSGGQQSGISRAISKENKEAKKANASIGLPYARASLESDTVSVSSRELPETGAKLTLVAPKSDEVRLAIEAWNELAIRQGWAQVAKLTPARRQAVAARLREHGFETWLAMLGRIAALDWINDPARRSAEHRNWQPHIDWFAKAATFLKLVEGAYGAGETTSQPERERRLMLWRHDRTWHASWGPKPDDLFTIGATP